MKVNYIINMKRDMLALMLCLFTAGIFAQNNKVAHEAVDLGLSSGTLWASCNIGANKPEQYGNYYSWGETKTKKIYDITNAIHYLKEGDELKKKNVIDDECNLTEKYDVARQLWGEDWSIPTAYQVMELMEECKWQKQTVNGIKCWKATGPNGNSIIFPACGFRNTKQYGIGEFGDYWTSSFYSDGRTAGAWRIMYNECNFTQYSPYMGLCVRPVQSPDDYIDGIVVLWYLFGGILFE